MNIYKVMIVDDEKRLRNVLKKTIRWEYFGFELVGEAASGIEAINIIDELMPDLIFIDIQMPFMNGIELSKIITKRYPHIKIIILTAYDEFEYARQCIGIGVESYQLKPIDKVQINEQLQKVRVGLEQSKNVEVTEQAMTKQSSTIEQIKEYIIKNYQDPELNLTFIAMEFGFNPNYLSRRFKEKSGMAFMDYLNGCRMEHAISRAHKDRFMYQIANEVGIPDPNYFGKVFKKYTGYSYSEYAKNI